MQRLLPLIDGLHRCGRTVNVMTQTRFRDTVERVGGRFYDLYAQHPIEAADATSIPMPSRFVTFTAVYAESLINAVAALQPGVLIYDTYSVMAPFIARRLGIPYVNVCAGHAAVPSRVVAELREDPRVAISTECWAAVQRLKDVYGMRDANPFSYVEGLSPFLNLYCEPSEFLTEEDRVVFEPIAFFGALAPALREGSPAEIFSRTPSRLKIYVSFGTVIWRYFAPVAYAALEVIARSVADLDADVVISLGRHALEATARAALLRPNVQVVDHT
ncbi:MAG: hypothetical protein ACRDL7_05280, partial [Gaiellaceae bacterium]